MRVYETADCTGDHIEGTVAAFTGSGITVNVAGDATTALSAQTRDAAGNLSTCSNTINYVEDSTAPAAPAITDTDPDSPSNDEAPEVKGTTGAGSPTHVRVYETADCTGGFTLGTVAAFTGAGITVTVTQDATTPLSATTVDAAGNASTCSNTINYVEDSTAPAAPTITDTDPDSPANDNDPEVKGTTSTGSPTHVQVYETADCSGGHTEGTVAAFTGSGISVNVAGDTTTALSAKTRDAAGNLSDCSNTINYTEDSTPPAKPTLATSPASPANDNNPELTGTTDANTAIDVYKNATARTALTRPGRWVSDSGRVD